MAVDGHRTTPRRDIRQLHEAESLTDGGYACVDAEWDEMDESVGLQRAWGGLSGLYEGAV